MFLHRDDIVYMAELINKFPDADTFELVQNTSSGIGAHTTLRVRTKIADVDGEFEMIVSSVENW